MAKTYLQLVNEVLKRMRETTVSSVNDNSYSTLVSTFINDAKTIVEDAWIWECLRTTVNFNLSASVLSYDLSSTALVGSGNELNERSLLLYHSDTGQPMAFDVTSSSPFPLLEISRDEIARSYDLDSVHSPNSTPTYFSVTPSTTAPTVRLYEPPSATRNWRMYFKRPQADLSSDGDILIVPWLPVVLLATNYALNERGEEVGEAGSVAEQKYLTALSNAIALDSRYRSGQLVFEVE